MKPKRLKLVTTISVFTSSIVTTVTVFASDVDYKLVKKNLSQITSQVWFKDSWFGLDATHQ